MANFGSYTVAEGVRQYCLHQFNDKRKYFPQYLAFGKLVWEDLFLRTLWSHSSEWAVLRTASPYPYLQLPCPASHLLGIFYQDDCNKDVGLFINNSYNVLAKPKTKTCGCKAECSCDELCGIVNSFSFTSSEITIPGAPDNPYTQKSWLTSCPNGDVLQWDEIPIPKFHDNGTLDMVIIAQDQKLICKVETFECGCVKDSDVNIKTLADHCGAHMLAAACKTDLVIQPNNKVPEIKFSDCGKKVYVIGANQSMFKIVHQSVKAAATSQIPHFALITFMKGIYHHSVMINPTISREEKKASKNDYETSKTVDIVEFLNPIDLDELARMGSQKKQWG